MRADPRYSLSDLRLIKKSGCYRVSVGIESLDTRVLNRINKGYTADQAVGFLRKLIKSGIFAQLSVIVDLPGTTYKSALGQLRIFKEMFERAAKNGIEHSITAQRLQVSRNAPLGICPEKYGIELAIPKNRNKSDYVNYLPYLDRQGMSRDEASRILELYHELNLSLYMIRSGGLQNRKWLYPSDKLSYQKDAVLAQDHLFDPDGEDGSHRKAPCAFIRLTNLQNGLYLMMPNANLVRWILKRLPVRFSDLRRVFRKEAPMPYRMDEHILLDSINGMISIGVLKV